MRIVKHLCAVMILLSISSVSAAAATYFRATLEDIQHDPERYYGYKLRITGKAIEPCERGYYFENDIGNRVQITTNKLPVFSVEYDIVVQVVEREDYYMPQLIEIEAERKKHTGGYSWLILSVVITFMGFLSVGV